MEAVGIEKKSDEMVAGWFKDHVVKEHATQKIGMAGHEIELLIWKQPGTRIYQINYLRMDNVLMVSGDVGEAIYAWSEVKDLRWISGLDISYFASKCQASEKGSKYEEWNRDRAKEMLEDRFKSDEEDGDRKTRKIAEDLGVWHALYFRDEWLIWLAQNGHEVWEDLSDLADIGMEVSLRCRSHLAGLRMAFERMDKADGK
jgi:hypothetical protein